MFLHGFDDTRRFNFHSDGTLHSIGRAYRGKPCAPFSPRVTLTRAGIAGQDGAPGPSLRRIRKQIRKRGLSAYRREMRDIKRLYGVLVCAGPSEKAVARALRRKAAVTA